MKLVSIFHPGRCGSTILERVIANTGVYHFGEVFRTKDNIYTRELPDNSWSAFGSINDFLLYITSYAGIVTSLDTSSRVFKSSNLAFLECKLNNYGIDPFASLAHIIHSETVAGGVFLYSKNYLRKYISIARARSTGVWHTSTDQKSYEPKLLDIDFEDIHDPDIVLLHHKPFVEAVSWYKRVITTQYEVIKQSCAISTKPLITISFEDIIAKDGVVTAIERIYRRFGLGIGSQSIISSFKAVPLKRTGGEDLMAGLADRSKNQFQQIPSYHSYLPGGAYDLILD